MLAFVTSLRHPDNADDYGRVERLLLETLRSLWAQTSDENVVIIVGNRAPSFELPARTHFVQVNFSAPAGVDGPHADRNAFVRDKGTKIGVGLIAARQFAPDMVMIFDADDFIHRDVTAFVAAHPAVQGWVVRKGWVYSRYRNGYRKQKKFNETCGTCYVVPYSAYNVPTTLSVKSTQDEIEAAYGDVLPNIMGAHREAMTWHARYGRRLAPLPFRAAVYHVDTGENHSGKTLPGLVRPWSRRLQHDFSISRSEPASVALVRSVNPRALRQSIRAYATRAGNRARRIFLS